ncbi:hypothetical protein SAMN05421818_1463 [Myroides phaeus]|uniref:VWFA domain-containing protein n=1 Tax=Myroides phaeus TaxID=702745 RepID=A0A1G8H7E4_9FLAO|nr:hypothetical protein SAMN05421818_1463 [Myroides phaeus]
MKFKTFLILICFLFLSFPMFSQHSLKEKKYIFELDITKSMWGIGEPGSINIFDQVRTQLIKAIENIDDPSAEIVLVTWQDQIISTWKESANSVGKERLVEQLKKITVKSVPGQNTNIYNAWIEAKKHVNPSKINIVYLLTDGRHSVPNPPISKLYNEIPKWASFSAEKDAYMFLVELTSQAIDNKMRSLVEATDKVEFIHGIEFYTLFVNNTSPIINIDEKLEFTLNINKQNLPEKYNDTKIGLQLNSDLFEIVNPSITLEQTPTAIKLRLKKSLEEVKASLSESSILPITIIFDDSKYKHIKLINKEINCKIINKKEKVFYFNEL